MEGSLFIGGHATLDLVRVTVKDNRIVDEERLLKDLQPKPARFRDVRQGPEGVIYLLTDDTKGRMIKLVPKK